MKKVILPSLLLLALQNPLSAQTQKGTLMLGANLMNANRADWSDRTGHGYSLNLNPEAGYFVKDNFALGLKLNIEVRTGSNNTYGATPFARYYLPVKDIAAKKLRFFGEVSAGITAYTYYHAGVENNPTLSASGAVGADYFILPNASLEAALNFSYQKNGAYRIQTPGISLGFKFFMSRKPANTTTEGETTTEVISPVSKGTVLTGLGSANASSFYYQDKHTGASDHIYNSYSLYAKGGYFLNNNFMLGTSLSFAGMSNPSLTSGTIEPFARYYLPVKHDGKAHNLRFYGELSAGVGLTRSTSIFSYPDHVEYGHNTEHFFTGSAGIGANYFITPHVSLETGLQYKITQYDGAAYRNLGFSAGFNIFLFKKR